MNTTLSDIKNQTLNSDKSGAFCEYFSAFKIGTLLNRSGIIKTKGVSPLTIFTALFNLSFSKTNLYQGIVKNKEVPFDKDAAYNFLNTPTYNWRRFTLLLFRRIYFVIRNLLDDSTEEVLIFDDSTYDRNRSKKVELLSRVFDHTNMKYIKGFRMLTLGWSDGNTFLGMDFVLLSSANKKNRYNEINSKIDKRTCGYHRRQEAVTKTTDHLVPMVKRALGTGVRAKYVLEEMANLTFMVSLERIMRLALAKIQGIYAFSEQIIQAMLDMVMGQALKYFGLTNVSKELLEA